jgi:hypothetical protein
VPFLLLQRSDRSRHRDRRQLDPDVDPAVWALASVVLVSESLGAPQIAGGAFVIAAAALAATQPDATPDESDRPHATSDRHLHREGRTWSRLVRLEAKEGRADEVAEFLGRAGHSSITSPTPSHVCRAHRSVDVGDLRRFPRRGQAAHLGGPVAPALIARADDLFSGRPIIENVDVVAAKLPPR